RRYQRPGFDQRLAGGLGRAPAPHRGDAGGGARPHPADHRAAVGGGRPAQRAGGSGRGFSISQLGPKIGSGAIRVQRKPAASYARAAASFLTDTTAQQAIASLVANTSVAN